MNMPNHIRAWAAVEPGKPLELMQLSRPPLEHSEVKIAVDCVGLCHSDLHLLDGDWGDESVFPQVCGHEIIGRVVEKGSSVDRFDIGQRVGVGWQSGSCLSCDFCLSGHEQLCDQVKTTCSCGEVGGFADTYSCDESFVFDIPEEISSPEAAPLLCAGLTVYSALAEKVRAGQKVAILGIGGLGHLAIQFATKMGCEVTAVSSSAAKRQEAESLGAVDFLETSDPDALARAEGRFDFILVTTGAAYDWPLVFQSLRPLGQICFAGIPNIIPIEMGGLIYKANTVTTVNIGGRATMIKMFDFARRYNVRPWVETLQMSEINQAISRLRRNEARYRIVVENPVSER